MSDVHTFWFLITYWICRGFSLTNHTPITNKTRPQHWVPIVPKFGSQLIFVDIDSMTSVWMHVDRKFDIGGSNLNCTCFIVHNMIDKNDIYLTQVVSVVENIFRPTFWAFWTHPAFTSRSLFPWLGLWTDFFQIIAINRYFFHQKSLFCLKGFFFWKFSIVKNIFLQWKMFLKNSSISSCIAS